MSHRKRVEAGFLILGGIPGWGDPTKNLQDNYGKMIWAMLYNSEFPMNDTAVDFIWNNAFEKKQRYNRVRQIIARRKPKVILALGQDVLNALGIGFDIDKCRGSRFTLPGTEIIVVPTYEPQQLRAKLKFGADDPIPKHFCAAWDVERAVKSYDEGYKPPPERFIIEPTIEDFRTFLAMVKKDKPLLGGDLEGTGLSIEKSKVYVHGFAWTESDAICIPEYGKNFEPYWTPEEWVEVKAGLNWIYANGRLLYQNGVGYDVPLLRFNKWDFKLKTLVHDTMVMHHAINPELPHNIAFIASQFAKTEYWKEAFLIKTVKIHQMEQLSMRRYNCRDCVVLIQAYHGMWAYLNELMASDDVYKQIPDVMDRAIKVSRVAMKMKEVGMAMDSKKITVWRKWLKEGIERTEKLVREAGDLPPSFNLASGADKRYLVYGETPPKLEKVNVLEELRKYDEPPSNYQYECLQCGRKITKRFYSWEEHPDTLYDVRCAGCKAQRSAKRTDKEPTSVKGKSKETARFMDLKDLETLANTKPLYRLNGFYPLKSEEDNSKFGKGAIIRYIIHIDKRLDEMSTIRRRRPSHDIEEAGLRRTKAFLIAYSEYGTFQKLVSSFWDFDTWEDGMIRPTLRVTGTATGRFSCVNPNL